MDSAILMTDQPRVGFRPWLVVITVIVASLGGAFGALSLAWLAAHTPWLAHLTPGLTPATSMRAMIVWVAPVLAVTGVPVVCLLIEAAILGFERSALRRLLFGSTPTARNDLFYLLIRSSGLTHIMAFMFSLGTAFLLGHWLGRLFGIAVMHGKPFILQFIVFALLYSLLFYWAHRMMHLPWLWELHKVHHSAEELNVVTPLRNHPVDLAVMTILYAAPLAILGCDPGPATAYLGLNAFYQCLVHSGVEMRHPWLEKIIITSNAHRLHHSSAEQHMGRNFGALTLWDKMFGTYLPPTEEPAAFGVENQHEFNTGRYFHEIFAIARRCVRNWR